MPEQNPLEDLILQALKPKGFDKLSQTDQTVYLAQFVAEADRRLSIGLVPLLSEDGMKEHLSMTQNNATPQQWSDFWNKNIEDFPAVISKILADYIKEISAAFNM
ncbi:MAG: hypothetical protein WCV83_00685 [Candidatus Magasanikbacteria bacterium]|jgi:hypothetical protein